jgi:isochorismate pyruvate lyase
VGSRNVIVDAAAGGGGRTPGRSSAWQDGVMAGPEESLADVRRAIDAVDVHVVGLLAERERLVRRAAGFKKNEQEVRAPARVEQVIEKVRALALERDVSPQVVERVYRAMIAAFIDLEMAEHREGH